MLLQIKRMLPAQGYLTQRMAQLRSKAHQIRNGHIARLEETRHAFVKLQASAKKKAAAELAARYNQMVGIDARLERLDKAVAENEKRIRELTSQAQEYTVRNDYPRLLDTLKAAESFGKTVGKTVFTAKDAPGFIVNRLLMPYMLEAMRILEAGFATKEDIDQGIVLGLNYPMGPFTLADYVGLDTIYFVCNAIYDEFKDPRYAPPPLLRKMVTAGQFGRKSGIGFYDYR